MARRKRELAGDEVVTLALAIADREGLGAVSFRRLGDELGVTAMALYHHVQDKAGLLGKMTDRVLGEVMAPAEAREGTWQAALRGLLRSFVSVRERHPCTADLLHSHFARSTQAPRLTELALQILAQAGFPPAEGMPIVQQLGSLLVVRSSAPGPRDQPPADPVQAAELRRRYPLLASLAPWQWPSLQAQSELGVELLILGIEGLRRARIARGRVSSVDRSARRRRSGGAR